MDLREVRAGDGQRHPWELARAMAVERIVRQYGPSTVQSVLDYGCGDGFTGLRVQRSLGASNYCGVDLYLGDEKCTTEVRPTGRVQFTNDQAAVTGTFSLVLMCDVIEHVEDDVALLGECNRRLEVGGRALVTVPAFQSLFSSHDRALRHFRRYSLPELERAVTAARFEVVSSGYLFSSLLAPRLFGALLEKLVPRRADPAVVGIGGWNGGTLATRALVAALEADNAALLKLGRLGLKLPGLTAWAMCSPGSAPKAVTPS